MLVLLAPLAAAEPARPPLRTVDSLDLSRYEGRWYEVARLPNKFQDACAGNVQVRYTLLENGRVSVFNQCSEADGDLRSVQGVARKATADGPPSRLQVRFAPAWLSFLPMVWADYYVIDLAPDYGWAVVGQPSREYFGCSPVRPGSTRPRSEGSSNGPRRRAMTSRA